MTRINLFIPVVRLTDQHLLAEFRELARIPRKVKKYCDDDRDVNVSTKHFSLGTGHVTWFYDKLGYLNERYIDLYNECKNRDFDVTFDNNLFASKGRFQKYMNGVGTVDVQHCTMLLKERISTRILESKQIPRYYRKQIDKHLYINTILNGNISSSL